MYIGKYCIYFLQFLGVVPHDKCLLRGSVTFSFRVPFGLSGRLFFFFASIFYKDGQIADANVKASPWDNGSKLKSLVQGLF